jgi:hypothetical protein
VKASAKYLRLSLLLVILLQGCGTDRIDRHLKQAVAVLEQRSDADSLAAAAATLRLAEKMPDSDAALELIGRATMAAPERPDLTWLEIQICREVPSCNPEVQELHLRDLDAANGAPWINALVRANASNDEAARIVALSALAQTDRVDIYWTTLIVHLTRALAASRKIPVEEALVSVIGAVGAEAIPPYSSTFNMCKGERLNRAEAIEDCRRVALAFERGDTEITEMLGVAIAKRVWPPDSPEWNAAADARRAYEYRAKLLLNSALNWPFDAAAAEKFLALCAQNRREQDVERAEIIQAGNNPDPPPDWTQ